MLNTRLKYRLKEVLTRLYGTEEGIRKAKEAIQRECEIPLGTINYDLNIRMSSESEIPDIRLQKYACFLKVKSDFLKADYLEYLSKKELVH